MERSKETAKSPSNTGSSSGEGKRTTLPKAKSPKKKGSNAFVSDKEAAHIVTPTLINVVRLVRAKRYPTVPGWLNRLKMWLMRLERGNKYDARTPIFKALSYSEIESRLTGLVRRNLSKISDMYHSSYIADRIYAVEEHQADKIGPRGVFPPASDWMPSQVDTLMSDYAPSKDLDRDALRKAIDDLAAQIKTHSLKPGADALEEAFKGAGTEDASDKSLNVDTNSCAFSYVHGWYHAVWTKAVSIVQRMTQMLIVQTARRRWNQAQGVPIKDWRKLVPTFWATANQRTNVADGHKPTDKNTYKGVLHSKLRFVSAMPKDDTVIGKVFLNLLLPAVVQIKNLDGSRPFIALTTPPRIDKNMQRILHTARENHLIVLSTDFSHFDQSVAPWLAWEIAKRIVEWFEPSIQALFLAWVYAAFYNTGMITSYKIYPPGPGRMKSGSWLTNIFDSFINYVSQRYGLHVGIYKSILAQVVQGDDAILLGEGCTPENFEKVVAQLGFEGNADKQGYDAGILYFCQKMHIYGFPGGIYPISRATAALVSLEDDVRIETDEAGQFPYVLSYRTVCRLDSACFNPLFAPFVKIVAAEDKIHLGSDMSADQLAKLAGSYHTKMMQEYNDKPWKAHGVENGKPSGFSRFPVNRVLRGELPPPPGVRLFEWVYGISYSEVEL